MYYTMTAPAQQQVVDDIVSFLCNRGRNNVQLLAAAG
jgi:hypothetical protein